MCNPPTDVDELFDCYNCTISDILDRLAPFAYIKCMGGRSHRGMIVDVMLCYECYVTKLKTRRLEKAYGRHPN